MPSSRLKGVAAIVVCLTFLAYEASASTLFMPDGDTAALVAILHNGIETISALNLQLGEMRKLYTATKKLASYADDSRQAFASLVQLDFGKLDAMVERAVPNAGFFGREVRYGYQDWGQGTGELQVMLGMCLNDQESQAMAAAEAEGRKPKVDPNAPVTASQAAQLQTVSQDNARRAALLNARAQLPGFDPCADLQRRLSGQEVANSLERVFGAPAASPATQKEAEGLAAADAQTVRNTARELEARQLVALCSRSGDPDQCADAAHAAEIGAFGAAIETNEQLATLNRTEASRAAQEEAAREQARREQAERNQVLNQAIDKLSEAPRVVAPGFTFEESP